MLECHIPVYWQWTVLAAVPLMVRSLIIKGHTNLVTLGHPKCSIVFTDLHVFCTLLYRLISSSPLAGSSVTVVQGRCLIHAR